MGWQQYSRPLWLSRPNHYILYLKAMTAQMPTLCLFFHSNDFFGLPRQAVNLQFDRKARAVSNNPSARYGLVSGQVIRPSR
jgi:hypothetical protein